jgi:hypothetical protein
MKQSELAAQLREWNTQFKSLVSEDYTVPDKLWEFLASRVAECGAVQSDPDVVTIRTGSGPRRVRITGTHGPRLTYEYADGARGFGVVAKEDVVEGPGKVTEILERLLKAGKVKEG